MVCHVEPLNTELKQTSSVMESEHGSTPTGSLRVHADSSANDVDLSTTAKKLRSSSSKSFSSSPDLPFIDPFKDDEYETDKSSAGTGTTPAKLHEDTQLASNYGEKDASGISKPQKEQSNDELPVSTLPPAVSDDTTQLHKTSRSESSPTVQVMDQSGDSTYRIPSYVFARTKSTAPVDWSVASNESLFSIHMGNMSFSKDPMFWLSGELGLPGQPTTSPQIFNLTDTGKLRKGNVAEAAVETMKEVIRESSDNKSIGKSCLAPSVSSRSDASGGSVKRESSVDKSIGNSSLAPSVSSRSDASGTSVKSFAFPILTGDLGRSGSLKRSSSPRVGPEPLQTKTQTQPLPSTLSKSQPHLQPELQQPSPKTTPQQPMTWTSWLSCFTCCSCCSCRS